MSSKDRASLRALDALYRCHGEPGSTEWVRWTVENRSRFNGQFGDMLSRRDGERAILRFQPHLALANVAGTVHGGAIMTLVDLAMFLGCHVLGCWTAERGGQTVDCNVQFVGAADIERPLDTIVELTRETGRFLFVRGTIEQEGDIIASFMGILRKPAG